MGQAKNRGTLEERQAAVLEVKRLAELEVERKEMEQQRIVSENWQKMSQDERDAHLEAAKADVSLMALINSFLPHNY